MNDKQLPHQHGNQKVEETLGIELENHEKFQMAANIFKQLGDSNRLRIYWLLCHSEECVMNISALVEMTSPAVCHHLRTLKESGLIVSRRVGKEVYYRAAEKEENRHLDRAMEKIMEVSCPSQAHTHDDCCKVKEGVPHRQDEIALMESLHHYLTNNLHRRITIEDLAKQYHMNTTTLKMLFKSIYGTSIATHIKKHRLEKAAALLVETETSINDIAFSVGYENHGKFTAAFKAMFLMSPKEYRKRHLLH